MQSTLHQERLLRQERESAAAQFEIEKLELQARCVDLEAKLRVNTQLELAPFSGRSTACLVVAHLPLRFQDVTPQ